MVKRGTRVHSFLFNNNLLKCKRSNSRSDILFNENLLMSKRSNSRLHFHIMNKRLLKCKRSQSQIISTVLLILLVIVAAGLIFAFVVPFVKNRLSSGNCLDVIGKVEISSGYTCYNPSDENMSVQVHIADIQDLIDGFVIELGGASSKSVKIINNSKGFGSDFFMYGNEGFSFPENNEERTYIIPISNKPDSIKVYPVLKGGKTCDVSDVATEVETC